MTESPRYTPQAGLPVAPGILDGDTDTMTVFAVNNTNLDATLNQNADDSFSFTPDAGFVGQTSFGYTVGDGFGGFDSGTVTIDVLAQGAIIHLGNA